MKTIVTIKRNTGLSGMGISVNLLVNGKKDREIKYLETVVLDIPVDGASIQVSQTGLKSKPIKVYPGEELEIHSTNYWLYLLVGLALLPIINTLANRLLDAPILYFIYCGLLLLIFLLYFFMDGYHFIIKKINAPIGNLKDDLKDNE